MKYDSLLWTVIGLLALGAAFSIGMDVGRDRAMGEVPGMVRAATGSAVLYGAIDSISPSGQVNFQLVEWVPGSDNQEQAALETGRCSLEQIEQDACLSNPFFVRETDMRLSLPLATDARLFLILPDASGSPASTRVRHSAFLRALDHDIPSVAIPFLIRTEHGVITEIEQQYIP